MNLMNLVYPKTVATGLLLLLCGASALAQQVMRPDMREENLEVAQALFNRDNQDLVSQMENMPNPFVRQSALEAARKAEEAAIAAARAANPEIDPEQVRQTGEGVRGNREALQLIARSFKPSGALDKGGVSYVLVPRRNGGTQRLAEGSSFQATIDGFTYRVFVENVDSSGYSLRIGDTVINRQYIQNRLEGITPGGG